MGLSAAELKTLSPAAQKLTKGDLVAAMQGKIPPAVMALTIRDLNSITNVYAARAVSTGGGGGGPGCCCCCIACCCCCCAASIAPERLVTSA